MKFAVNEIDERVANYKKLQTRAAELDQQILELRRAEEKVGGPGFDKSVRSLFNRLHRDREKVLRAMDIELQLVGYSVIRNW